MKTEQINPNVNDTVYFEDAFDRLKRYPVNFRGWHGGDAVVIWNGRQMQINKERIFLTDI